MPNSSKFTPQATQDGSYTFYSKEFQEAFHSSFGAKQEAEVRYIEPCQLKQLAANQSIICLLDICYGLGYNSAAALEAIWSVNPKCRVELIGLEISADVPLEAIEHNLLDRWHEATTPSGLPPIPQLLAQLGNKSLVQAEFFTAKLLLGDARQTIQSVVTRNWQADAIFLDPFSPPKCPQLWTVQFIKLVAQCLKPTGRLATYSCAAAVRTALRLAGLQYGSTPSMGRKSPGTVASLLDTDLPPLSTQEQEHLQTRAAIPYRDIYLSNSAEQIKQLRQQEQSSSNLQSTSQWKKRWQKFD